ncbi:hypothetical protein [Aquabacterium sp.]|uniref:hypothetical protein n=1 Tax=Aquabacterium sp. TaxID=1872578 RepID=UPI002486EC0E|nr:hypothetical protein [Aquabacterium sp.]MDI1258995.1 hypothetical protein [Aquabacterium sp.]
MSIYEHIAQRLRTLGVEAEVRQDRCLYTTVEGITTKFRGDEEWETSFIQYRRARSSNFDSKDWGHALNNSIEIPLARLDPDIYREPEETTFEDSKGNTVVISRASLPYSLAHFDSDDYARYFLALVKIRVTRPTTSSSGRPIAILFRKPLTATYSVRGRRTPTNLKEIAIAQIKSCLFKLAVERHTCYEIASPKESKALFELDSPAESDWIMPRVSYEENLVNYYKVARSSPFSSQSFLAYYHVLEYYFLRVAEDNLHHQLKTVLNGASFQTSTDGLDRVISLIRKQASQDDETEMLRKVLQRFSAEDAFIAHVNKLEALHGEKIYTRKRAIFGEQLEISAKEGHALSNAAKFLKHVRNAIVHSSDKYKRDECHIPLTATERIIEEFIPIIKYFAEQVIFGTAIPHLN